MQPPAPHSFYDIEPLQAWLDEGVPIITPNFRLARRIKLAWGQLQWQRGHRAWATPAVMSLEHWWLHCLDCHKLDRHSQETSIRLASESQELELWMQCVSSHPDSAALLRPRAAAQLARDAWRSLLLWELDPGQAELARQFTETADGVLFLEWLQEFRQRLENRGLSILPQVAPSLVGAEQREQLVLAEFDELPPLYENLLSAQTANLTRFSNAGETARCRVQPCSNLESELRLATLWARKRLEQGGSVAILVPDLAQRRHTVERILRETFNCPVESGAELPANISAGVPLERTSAVNVALNLLSLHCEDPDIESLVALLHSPYRRRSDSETELALLKLLYEKGNNPLRREDLRYWSSRLQEEGSLGQQLMHMAHSRELEGNRQPGEWASRFGECLDQLGWPGPGPLQSEEYQQLEHWFAALERLGEFDAVCGLVDYAGALQLLRQLCASTVFQAQTAEASLQVLGLLEASGLQFDNIWACGLDSNAWPPPAAPNPFIPLSLQRGRGMPHADAGREHHYAERLLQRFLHSCVDLVASYTLVQDDIPQEPSPLLATFPRSPLAEAASVTAQRWKESVSRSDMERVDDRSAPPVTSREQELLRGGSGLLADQSHCPFRALVHHRLNARALRATGVNLTPAQRGNLLHDALYRLWGEIESQEALLAMDVAARQSLANLAARGAVEDFAAHHPATAGREFLLLETRRLQELLLEWLQLEESRQPFRVIEREDSCSLELAGLTLRLRIDRIDQTPGGDRLVLDYKSGNASSGAWLGERPEEPQLPLYSVALEGRVGGLVYARVRKGNCGYDGLARGEQGPGISSDIAKKTARSQSNVDNWEELQSGWRSRLESLAEEFMRGEARVDPLGQKSCRYCGLQALCRIGEINQ